MLLTNNSGTYQLLIHISVETEICVGALGKITFPSGYYVYTGSAMKNLRQRIERHQRKEKKLKWHIDYILNESAVKIIRIFEYHYGIKDECKRNLELLNLPGAKIIAKGLGSSDCGRCPSHLVYISESEYEKFLSGF